MLLKKTDSNNNNFLKAEFISVLDCSDGGIVRILVEGKGANVALVSCWDAEAIYIGWPQGASEFSSEKAVFSLKFRKPIPTKFKVKINGKLSLKMSPEILDALTRLKNCTFVNPEIDGFYNEIQMKEDYVYVPKSDEDDDILFSIIVPLYKTPPAFFTDLVKTLLSQTYTNFEVILVNSTPDFEPLNSELERINDKRVRIVKLDKNYGIVGNSNRGISHTMGDYVMFVDHDDAVSPNFLECYLAEINRYKEETGEYPDLLTCDEDRFVELDGSRFRPVFKNGYCEDLHVCLPPFLGHCVCVRKSCLSNIKLSTSCVEGSQDYDLCLKVEDLNRRVAHVQEIVYHWRQHPLSISSGEAVKPYIIESMKKSINDAFSRRKIKATVVGPRWSFVFNPHYDDLKTIYKVISYREFDSISINRCINSDTCDYSVIYNCDYFDDIDNIDLYELVERLKSDRLAVAAPKLIYPDGMNFMSGLVLSDGNVVAVNQNFENGVCGGYRGYAECDCDYTAVSPHIFAISKCSFEKIGGFRDFGNKWLSVIDYCIRANKMGLDVCVTNSLVLKTPGDVSWANLKDEKLITSSGIKVPSVDPGVLWERDSDDSYLGLGKLPDEIETIKDRLYNKHVDYRTGYPHLNVDVPREVYPN